MTYRVLNQHEVDLLADAGRRAGRYGLRDSTLILLCYRYGLRPLELANLKWKNLDFNRGTIEISRVRGAGVTRHYVERDDLERLERLKEEVKSSKAKSTGPVFLTERMGRLTTRGVHQIIKRAGELAGFDFAVNPSMLRRSCSHSIAKENSNPKQLQSELGFKHLRNASSCMQRLRDEAVLADSIPRVAGSASSKLNGWDYTLEVPASIANIGPGLDTLALAVNLYTRLHFRILPRDDLKVPKIQLLGGIITDSQARDQGDLIYTILKKLLRKDASILRCLRISIDSDVPLGCGLGSSGTAVLGALWAAHVLKGEVPTRSSLLAQAQDIESHAETLAASMCGQMVVCASTPERVLVQQLAWPQDWRLLVVVPPYTLTTPVARSVLPKMVSLEDAIFNMQRTAMVVAAVSREDEQTMKEALVDRLHEQRRAALVPELIPLKQELKKEPIIGCVLSGAGSSVVTIVARRHKAQVVERLTAWIERKKARYRLLDLEVDRLGMKELTPR